MKDVLIVGNGIVGHNLAKEIAALEPEIYDKYKPDENTKSKDYYDVVFISVPTPYNGPEDPCNVEEVFNAVRENDAGLYIVKSCVLPGTTERLCSETGRRVVVSPEYYGSTQFANNYTFDFTILGGEKGACKEAVQLLQNVYDGRHKFYITEPKNAEIAKYMENCFLGMKVSFSNQFWEIAQEEGADYEVIRELFLLDPRVNPSHTFVFDDKPYWDSHCLNKDIPALAETYGAELLLSMVKYNNDMKEKYGSTGK